MSSLLKRGDAGRGEVRSMPASAVYAAFEARHSVTAADCPFCHPDPARIAWSEAPLVFALWDGFPVSPGHALVVPRRHAAGWADLTTDEQAAILAAVGPVRAV